ncbi:MAG: RNA-binding protein [Planctomycetaceae bacterium]|nr:RNA-binding protein [Planctomycetaceae bacterium]
MAKKLYVGNLNYDVNIDTLTEWFSAYGTVVTVNIVTDRETNQSKGYGFVEMETDEQATAAMTALNGSDQQGRSLKVAEANPPKAKPQRGGRGGFGGGGRPGGRPGGFGGGGGRRFGGGNREGGNREGGDRGPRGPRY